MPLAKAIEILTLALKQHFCPQTADFYDALKTVLEAIALQGDIRG